MDNRQRTVLLVLAAAVALLALVLLGGRGGDADDGVIDTRTAPTSTTPSATDRPREEASKRTIPTIVVRNGEPVGGVQRLRFRKGGDIVFTVRSDAAGHVHLHGYDILKDIVPGGRVRFDVPAKVDGRFEVELEDTATPIAEVEVLP